MSNTTINVSRVPCPHCGFLLRKHQLKRHLSAIHDPWSQVDASGDCWTWKRLNREGYGVVRIASTGKKTALAHRWVWEELVGPVPDRMQLDHLCRNRACVNPDHLEVVTQAENLHRGMHPTMRAYRANRCGRGHERTPENTLVTRHGRYCRPCTRERNRRYYAEGRTWMSTHKARLAREAAA